MSHRSDPKPHREPAARRPRSRRDAESLEFRRELRRLGTEAERRLWRLLRNRRFRAKFRRQHSIGPYVLDFFCAERGLAIELDGGQHRRGDEPARDARRTAYLAAHGVRVVRFTNLEWFHDPDEVVRAILRELGEEEKPAGRGEG